MIRSFLDASSGHLSPDTWSWLETNLAEDVISDPANNTAASIAGGKTRYGWFVYAPKMRSRLSRGLGRRAAESPAAGS